RIGTEEARTALIAALTGKDKDLAGAAAAALGRGGLNESTRRALLAAAADTTQVRVQVMRQLVTAGTAEGLQLAEQSLSGTAWAAATQAVWLLAQAPSADAKRLLARALESKDTNVRMAAISALGQSTDDRATETLLRFSHDADPGVRQTAFAALGQIGNERA